ncbi:MAG TPA: hypothetical protein VJK05_01470 [archaeon]|nr:hypothetical protein [archaeon]
MVTSIQIKESTSQLLKSLKKKENAKSYDEIIIQLIKTKPNKSMAGVLGRKKHYSRKELLKGLRDEKDRF